MCKLLIKFFKKENYFMYLPDDVILEILKYLDLPFMKRINFYNPENDILLYENKMWLIKNKSLIKCSQLNQRFYYLVNNPILWKFN